MRDVVQRRETPAAQSRPTAVNSNHEEQRLLWTVAQWPSDMRINTPQLHCDCLLRLAFRAKYICYGYFTWVYEIIRLTVVDLIIRLE